MNTVTHRGKIVGWGLVRFTVSQFSAGYRTSTAKERERNSVALQRNPRGHTQTQGLNNSAHALL